MRLFKFSETNLKKIDTQTSFVLDTLRIVAALIVVIFHGYEQWIPKYADVSGTFAKAAHGAVIIFFVLSGYVIAYTTSVYNRGGLQYAQARLSRLCSIVLPTLFVTALCQMTVYLLNPSLHSAYSREPSYLRYLLSGVFSNEIWFLSSAPPINSPLWSLSYEFWYYTIFGLWLYSSRGWKSICFTLLGCAVAGPKILLLLPVWLLGSFAFLLPKLKTGMYRAYFAFLCFVLCVLLTYQLPIYPYSIGSQPFYFSNEFLTDWITGFLLAAGLWLLPKADRFQFKSFGQIYRKIADLTFPLYVLHFPLLILWRAIFGYEANNIIQLWSALICVVSASALIGIFLEKYRKAWGKLFTFLLTAIQHARFIGFRNFFIKDNTL